MKKNIFESIIAFAFVCGICIMFYATAWFASQYSRDVRVYAINDNIVSFDDGRDIWDYEFDSVEGISVGDKAILRMSDCGTEEDRFDDIIESVKWVEN